MYNPPAYGLPQSPSYIADPVHNKKWKKIRLSIKNYIID